MREKKREREIVRRRREQEVDQSMPPIANDRETERDEESREKLMRDQRTIIPRATTDGALLVDTADGRRRVLAGDVSIRPNKK